MTETAAPVSAALLRIAVERIGNRLLSLDPQALARCARLAGKHVRIEIDGLGLVLTLGFDEDGIRLVDHPDVQADTTLVGTPLALLGLIGGRGPDALFSGQVRMHGDTLVGKRLHRLFAELDVDWEEQVAHFTGDFLAHRAAVWLRDLDDWRRRSTDSLAADLGEYLQEEVGLLARRDEVEALIEAIERFTQDVDRLEARVRLRTAAD